MSEPALSFNDFLLAVDPAYRTFAENINSFLLKNGCVFKMEQAKNGYVVSYSFAKTKRVLLNFVFRKSGLVARIYADFVNSYPEFTETAPDAVIAVIDKAPICKRLSNTAPCNSRCPMGYAFSIKGKSYIKCRYNCFLIPVNDATVSFLQAFIENEFKARQAAVEI